MLAGMIAIAKKFLISNNPVKEMSNMNIYRALKPFFNEKYRL